MRCFTQNVTYYCHDAACEGAAGFPIRWDSATLTSPSEPQTDSCPHCGRDMEDEPLPIEDAISGVLDELLIEEPATKFDAFAVARVIAVEVARQREVLRRWRIS